LNFFSNDFVTDAKANVIAQVFSEPFMVYSAKKVNIIFVISPLHDIFSNILVSIALQFPGMTGKKEKSRMASFTGAKAQNTQTFLFYL
jgi:hypothetical protein